MARVAVCSRSFSRDATLRAELQERYANVTFNDDGCMLSGGLLVDFLRGHDKAIVALEQIDDTILSRLPELNVISKYGVGVDTIDMESMRRHGKRLGWTGGVNRRSVAELTLAFAIVMLRGLPAASREVLDGIWRQRLGGLLTGRTFGIIGCGHIGKDLVRLLVPFQCTILVNDIRSYPNFYSEFGIEATELGDLLSRSDIVSLHVPLDDSTKGMISAKMLALMKPSAMLINTARGGIVDEDVLKSMLMEDRLAGAAFDVFVVEPPQDRELIALPNFLASPHLGGSSREAVIAMGRAAIAGLDENLVPDESWPAQPNE